MWLALLGQVRLVRPSPPRDKTHLNGTEEGGSAVTSPQSEVAYHSTFVVFHGVLWRIALGALRGRATPGIPWACYRPLVRFWWVFGGWLAHVDLG